MAEINEAKVVKVISPYQVVINRGAESGLTLGQKLLVYATGEMICDPETGEELETLEIVRGTGVVIHLQEKIATIESDMSTTTPITRKRRAGLGYMSSVFGNTEETELQKEEEPFEEAQIGDNVRLVKRSRGTTRPTKR